MPRGGCSVPQPPLATTPGISPSASSAFSPGYGDTWGGSCASPPCDSPPRQDSPQESSPLDSYRSSTGPSYPNLYPLHPPRIKLCLSQFCELPWVVEMGQYGVVGLLGYHWGSSLASLCLMSFRLNKAPPVGRGGRLCSTTPISHNLPRGDNITQSLPSPSSKP